MDDATCRGGDPDALFVRGAEQHLVKQACWTCPVRRQCLADALDSRNEHGVWGGATERERRAMLRRRPDVASWKQLLVSSREEFDAEVPAQRVPRRR
ncbi:WhiB family transcriptional regulator [Pseudokineococcus sp. 1T1Z-3]